MRRMTAYHPSEFDDGHNDDPNDDRGAVAIMVALVIVILIVVAAWVIDGSALYQERRELQTGADAAALAIARDCAEGNSCFPDYLTAQEYAGANSGDGETRVPPGAITFPNANTVRVAVRTLDPGGGLDNDDTTVDYVFAPVIGKNGLEVQAVSTVSWGSVGGGATIPLTISLCEFNNATNNGTTYTPGPPFSGTPEIFTFHDGGPHDPTVPCPAGPAGHDIPGGFGWLDINSPCSAIVDEDDFVGANPGNGIPGNGSIGCTPQDFLGPNLTGHTVMIPVYNDVTGTGQPGTYRIEGFAAIHIIGIRFPGNPNEWRVNMTAECGPQQSCIKGYFTEQVFPGEGGPGGSNFGAKTIWLVS